MEVPECIKVDNGWTELSTIACKNWTWQTSVLGGVSYFHH